MQQRRNAQTEKTSGHERRRDAAADDERSTNVMAPKPDDERDECAASDGEQKRRQDFAPQCAHEPAPGHARRVQRLDGDAHRLHAHAFVQRQHHREKKRDDETARERRLKHAGQERADRSAGYRREQPRKTITENAPGRGVAHLREMKAERLEKIVARGQASHRVRRSRARSA